MNYTLYDYIENILILKPFSKNSRKGLKQKLEENKTIYKNVTLIEVESFECVNFVNSLFNITINESCLYFTEYKNSVDANDLQYVLKNDNPLNYEPIKSLIFYTSALLREEGQELQELPNYHFIKSLQFALNSLKTEFYLSILYKENKLLDYLKNEEFLSEDCIRYLKSACVNEAIIERVFSILDNQNSWIWQYFYRIITIDSAKTSYRVVQLIQGKMKFIGEANITDHFSDYHRIFKLKSLAFWDKLNNKLKIDYFFTYQLHQKVLLSIYILISCIFCPIILIIENIIHWIIFRFKIIGHAKERKLAKINYKLSKLLLKEKTVNYLSLIEYYDYFPNHIKKEVTQLYEKLKSLNKENMDIKFNDTIISCFEKQTLLKNVGVASEIKRTTNKI